VVVVVVGPTVVGEEHFLRAEEGCLNLVEEVVAESQQMIVIER
jgi:hypothetical protein